MKKKDIKSDPIKERIVDFVNFIVENSNYVWFSLLAIVAVIVFATYYTANKKDALQSQNLKLGILQNKSIHSSTDSMIYEYEEILTSFTNTESYNQAFIYLLDYYIRNNNSEKVKSLLFENNFSSNDDLQNAFIYKLKGDYFNNAGNTSKAEINYMNAYEIVPNYELKILYCKELVNLYISSNKVNQAKTFFSEVKSDLDDYENLSFSSKNNLDYIESKLLHLVK